MLQPRGLWLSSGTSGFIYHCYHRIRLLDYATIIKLFCKHMLYSDQFFTPSLSHFTQIQTCETLPGERGSLSCIKGLSELLDLVVLSWQAKDALLIQTMLSDEFSTLLHQDGHQTRPKFLLIHHDVWKALSKYFEKRNITVLLHSSCSQWIYILWTLDIRQTAKLC